MPEIPVIRLVPLRTKVDNPTAQLTYRDSAIYERTLTEYRENLQVFLKEEAFLK